MKLSIGGIKVDIPGLVDAGLAERAADEVARRLQHAEANSKRIDTIAFALTAAHALAMELEQLKGQQDTDANDLAKALQTLNEALQDLLTEPDEDGQN